MSAWRRIAVALAAAVVLVVGAGVAAFASGLTLDLSRWRDAAAQQASAALGRPIALQGALTLSLGRPLRLHVGGLRIANPPGFGDAPFASVGQATVRMDLLDALRGRMRLRGVEASDIELRLERAADGRGNWSFASTPPAASTPSAIDVGPLKLQRLALHFHDLRAATQRSLVLDELAATLRPNDALQLSLQGGVEGQAYRLRLDGGTLQALQHAGEPWPFHLEFKSPAAWLQAQGTLDARQGQARFHLGAGADDLARAAGLLGARWPLPGGASLSAKVVASVDQVALTDLQGRLGEAEFSGQLGGSVAAARPRLSGALRIASLDLRPLLQADAPPQGDAPAEAQGWQTRALRGLVPLDLDLELRVDRWLGLPVAIDDAKLALRADPRGLRAPLSATLAGAALTGQLDLDLAQPTPTLALRLDVRDLALDALARDLPALQGLEGRLGHAALRLAGRGDTPAAVLRELESSLAMQAAQVRWRQADAAEPIAFTLDALQLQAGRGEALQGSARGTLLGQPTRLSLRAGTLPEMWRERAVPLQLALDQAQARLRVQGRFGPAETVGTTALGFDLQADSAGSLARWLPVEPQSNLPLALRGQLRMAPDAWSVEQTTLELGRSRLLVDARHGRSSGRPLTTARVRSTLIDVPQLSTLLVRRKAPATARAGVRLDAPLLAGTLDLADADLDLQLQQVWLGRTGLADVVLAARTREGRLLPSPASGKLAGVPFTALVALDASAEVPSASLELSTGDIDIGALLGTLGVTEGLDARAGSLQLALQARGNSLRELAAQTALDVQLSGGRFGVPGSAQRPAGEIRLHEASIEAPAGEPIRLRLIGTLDETPVRLQLSTGSFADFAGDATRVPFALAAQAADTYLNLDGEAALPLGSTGQLTFEMGGQRLDSLNELARVELPAWGPWSLRGPIRKSASGYEVQALKLTVGQSRLGGSGTLDLSGPRPRAELRMSAPSIQLDDFPLPRRVNDAADSPQRGEGLRGTARRTAGSVDRMLSARFLRRFDASVAVQADEVLSGTDRLVDGALQLTLQEGRLALDPAVLNLPGGGMRLSMVYDLKQSEVDFQVAARIERFDYGIIARRMDRAADQRGLFSLNLQLAGTAPSLDSIMRHANGKMDIAVWPVEVGGRKFNLWSANLVLTLLPLIDPGPKAEVNCVVARLDLKDGELRDDKIVIDTTRVRIRGSGHADLRTEELALVFRPRAKGPGLFRLQTPLRVTGTLFEPRFGFDPGDVFVSTWRMIASPILVPIEYFRLGPQPRDGADVCTDPIRSAAR